jgi:hypothetical protein
MQKLPAQKFHGLPPGDIKKLFQFSCLRKGGVMTVVEGSFHGS